MTPLLFAAAVLALVAPLTFAFLLRRAERYGRESWRWVMLAFILGALVVFPLAVLTQRLVPGDSGTEPGRALNLLLVAPVSEELLKAAGLLVFWRKITEPADGVVYGASIGFGFAAIENVGFAMQAVARDGESAAFLLMAERIVTASVLHAALTGAVGLCAAGWRARRGHVLWIPAALVGAIVLHAAYNGFVLAVENDVISKWVGVPIALAFWALVPLGVWGLRHVDGRHARTRVRP